MSVSLSAILLAAYIESHCAQCGGSGVQVDWRLRRPIIGTCPVCHGTKEKQPTDGKESRG